MLAINRGGSDSAEMQRLVAFVLILLLGASLIVKFIAQAGSSTPDAPEWAEPKKMAIKLVSSGYSLDNIPNFMHNLDCTPATYRLPSSDTMKEGCFTETAFGMFDSSSEIAIFDGTDEGLPLVPYTAHQNLIAWPQAGTLVSLDPTALNGSYVGIYKGILEHLTDQRNLLGQLTAKQLTAGADLHLKGPDGKLLVINPDALAFSEGGSWMVAEDLNGSFLRINLATLEELPFAPSYGSTGSPALLESQVAISQDGQFVAIANKAANSLKVYDLNNCDKGCKSYDYQYFIDQQVGGLQVVQHLRFVNDGLLSFQVQATNPAKTGVYELAPTDHITSLIDYLGLGDSYTSGEGAFDYISGTDTADNTCHLSSTSYPLLLTHDLFSSTGGHSVACSGAVIEDLGSAAQDYAGQVQNGLAWRKLNHSERLAEIMANFLPGYVSQQRFMRQWQPGITTVSVGGNDIGFGDIVEQCVAPHLGLGASNTCFNSYEDRIEVKNLVDRTVARWTALYKKLLAAAPHTRLYAIGYPQIAVADGNCALNVRLNNDELEFASELLDYLNNSIQKAATKAGISYIDISQALVGHRLCETADYNVAVNGLTAGNDFVGVLGRESYHPNALGHQLIEQSILRQTNNFVLPQPGQNSDNSNKLLGKPKSGRKVVVRVPGSKLSPKVVKKGGGTAVNIQAKRKGLKPNKPYAVRLDGPNGQAIGTVVSDSEGDVDTAVAMPIDVDAGGHTIDLTGENETGEEIDVTQPIYVTLGDDKPNSSFFASQNVGHSIYVSHTGPLSGPVSAGVTNFQAVTSKTTSGESKTKERVKSFGDSSNSNKLNKLKAYNWVLFLALIILIYLLILLFLLVLRLRRGRRYQKASVSSKIDS